MRKKNWAALLCSILILASIGLGVSIIYSDYYFSPVSGLQSFTVADVSRIYLHPEEDAGTPSAAAPSDELYALLERWALENEATILYKNGFAAGCGILDGSNWLCEAVGLSLPCDAQGVLTAEDAAFSETYVRDGRFLPDALGLPVLGELSGTGCALCDLQCRVSLSVVHERGEGRNVLHRWRGHQWSDGPVREPRLYGH